MINNFKSAQENAKSVRIQFQELLNYYVYYNFSMNLSKSEKQLFNLINHRLLSLFCETNYYQF